MRNDTIIIIPARMGSTRLPQKIIADVYELPLIIRIFQEVTSMNICDVTLAIDDQETAKILEKHNIKNYIMTNPDLKSGSDRIHEAYQKLNKQYKYIINLQGDMLNVKDYIITDVINVLEKHENCIATAVYNINASEIENNKNVVKAVLGKNNKALYFSRSTVPHGASNLHAHLGIYGYSSTSLQQFISLEESYLEKTEKLEQLRALENGISIYCTIVQDLPISIDVQEDLEAARKFYVNK